MRKDWQQLWLALSNQTLLWLDAFFSLDGVPFLMRDRTLRRTTNVDKLFPARQDNDASFFNWTEIRSLNAGLWFLRVLSSIPFSFLLSIFTDKKDVDVWCYLCLRMTRTGQRSTWQRRTATARPIRRCVASRSCCAWQPERTALWFSASGGLHPSIPGTSSGSVMHWRWFRGPASYQNRWERKTNAHI